MDKKHKTVNFKTPFSILLTKRNIYVPLFTCIIFAAALILINYLSLTAWYLFPAFCKNDFFILLWILGTLVSALFFIFSTIFFAVSIFKVITRRIYVDDKEVKIQKIFKTITVPRRKLKGIRMAQESKNDINHNVGTLRLLFKDGTVYCFGRVDHQLELARFMRNYTAQLKSH
ncbi:MAG TPA: hypothetical protein O0W90_03115 [Methanocorpusculum sp.]|nr:hypothetical protein [Methanocorpusculum sp.]